MRARARTHSSLHSLTFTRTYTQAYAHVRKHTSLVALPSSIARTIDIVFKTNLIFRLKQNLPKHREFVYVI